MVIESPITDNFGKRLFSANGRTVSSARVTIPINVQGSWYINSIGAFFCGVVLAKTAPLPENLSRSRLSMLVKMSRSVCVVYAPGLTISTPDAAPDETCVTLTVHGVPDAPPLPPLSVIMSPTA